MQTIDLLLIQVKFIRFKENFVTGRPVNILPLKGH